MIHRNIAALAAVPVLLATLAACSGAETRKARFLEKGQELMAQHDYAKARLEFRNALQIDPKDSNAQTLAGEAAEKTGDYREAAGLYRAASDDPTNLHARANLAKLYIFSGATDEARKMIDEGLARAPTDASLLAMRGATKMLKSDKGGARDDAEMALRSDPTNGDAAALLASILVQSGQRDEATKLMEGVVKAKPDDTDLAVVLSQLYNAQGRVADAEAQLQRVVTLDPKTLSHRYRVAQFQVVNKRIDAAEATLREVVRVAPDEVDPKLVLANFIASQRSLEAGERSLKALVAENKKDLQLQLGLGRFYEQHDKRTEAQAVYRAVIEADDADGARGIDARNRLAAIATQENRVDDARTQVEAILKVSPRDNDALALRANLALARGDAPAAIGDLRAVLRDQPNSQPLMRALAQAYQANGDDALVEETLRSAVQANPRDITTRLALAKNLIDAKRPDEAQPVIDQLVADQPGDVPALEAAFRVQVARNDFDGARRTAAAIQSVKPTAPTGYYLAGLVEEASRKLDAAAAAFEKALQYAPNAIEPLGALVRIDLARKDSAKALARIDAMIAKNPKVPLLRQLKADTLLALRRWDDVIAVTADNIKLAPKWWLPYRTQAVAQLGAKRNDKAVEVYQQGIDATGGAPQLITELAVVQERAGKPDLAIAQYEAWLKREPRSDLAANNLSMLLITYRPTDRNALDRALQLSQRFQASANAAFLDTYAWVRYLRGEYTQAVPPLQRAVDLAPRVPALRARLGLAQIGAGQRDAAKKNLESAFADGNARFPGSDAARTALDSLQRGG